MIGRAYNSRDFGRIPLKCSSAQMFGDICLPWILIYLDESFIRALKQSVTGIVLQLCYCYMVFMISFFSDRITENKYRWSLLTDQLFNDDSVSMLLNKIYDQSLKLQLLQCPCDHMIVIQSLDNQHTFMTVPAFCSHMITICNLHSQLPPRKSVTKPAGSYKLWSCDIMLNKHRWWVNDFSWNCHSKLGAVM